LIILGVTVFICIQWRRFHRAREHVPPLLQTSEHRGTMSRSTANNKLAKLHSPSRKRSPKQLIALVEPKKWRGTKKIFFRCFAPDVCPHF